MSIFGAMQSGVSGLAAQSSAMGMISDNITNVNTVGYKEGNVAFQTLVTKQTARNAYSPGGVQGITKQGVNIQGLLSSNVSSTAFAVSGAGYFVVNQAANPGMNDLWCYTRAGDFDTDNEGYLKNTAGFYAQGWPLVPWDGNSTATTVNVDGITYMKAYYDEAGNVVYVNDNIIDARNLQPINLKKIGGTADPTQNLSIGANLPANDQIYDPASGSSSGRRSISALIYDSLGNASNLSVDYTKVTSNSWNLNINTPSGAAVTTTSGNRERTDAAQDIYSATALLEFTRIPSNGQVINMTDAASGTTFSFEFTSNGTVQPGNIAVDTSTGVVSTSDAVQKLYDAITAVMPGAARFSVSANAISIEQSFGGAAIDFDVSTCLACVQSATNPLITTGIPTGRFSLPIIDEDIKNVGRLDFSTISNGNTIIVDGTTYTFTTTPAVGVSTDIDISGGATTTEAIQRLVTGIRLNAVEPERFVASGTTLEIWPSYTGPDITLDTSGVAVSGRLREATSGWMNAGSGTYTLSSEFAVNVHDVETGPIVPAVRFNADGTPKYFYANQIDIVWANGAQNMNGDLNQGTPINFFMGNVGTNDGLTSLAGTFDTNYIRQDGARFGTYAGVSINEHGIITALFDNGEIRPIGMLPLATFANPNGMGSLTGNVWIETDTSGQALLKEASTNGAGAITGNSLELSTVDLATEFSNMIITQRAYSAATKIITTSNEMLQELTNMT